MSQNDLEVQNYPPYTTIEIKCLMENFVKTPSGWQVVEEVERYEEDDVADLPHTYKITKMFDNMSETYSVFTSHRIGSRIVHTEEKIYEKANYNVVEEGGRYKITVTGYEQSLEKNDH